MVSFCQRYYIPTLVYFLHRCNCDFQEYIIIFLVSADKCVDWNAPGTVITEELLNWMPLHSSTEKHCHPFYFIIIFSICVGPHSQHVAFIPLYLCSRCITITIHTTSAHWKNAKGGCAAVVPLYSGREWGGVWLTADE